MNKISSMLTVALALLAAFMLASCNTIKGMGQDVQKAGSAIENAVKK
ncbi:MAG TPA: entericidin A/B family lipoprotein [Polaromonas sp.]|jgi:predicted small secreted protein